ncbi:MAG: CPBP family intramembrane metalloprotease [Promethearchaeota archaeon]|nr:MAG: CPBP family intramembrane metalloprotease [Candidatus Lokiarchaeota archaeon]
MKLREWFKNHPFWTAFFLFLILSLSVGIVYLSITDLFSLNDILIGLGLSSITVSLLSYALRAIIASVAIFVIIYFVFYQKPRNFVEYTHEFNLTKGHSWVKTFSSGLLSILIYLAVAIGLSMSLGILAENPFIFYQAPSDGRAGWLLLVAAINPGFFEEIGFRGIMFSNLEKKYKGCGVVILSAILFGLFHLGSLTIGENPMNVIFLVIMATTFGLAWGYMRLKTESIIPSMIVHYLIDALSEGLLSPNTTDQAQFGILMIGLIVLYPLFSILSTKLIFLSHDRQISETN